MSNKYYVYILVSSNVVSSAVASSQELSQDEKGKKKKIPFRYSTAASKKLLIDLIMKYEPYRATHGLSMPAWEEVAEIFNQEIVRLDTNYKDVQVDGKAVHNKFKALYEHWKKLESQSKKTSGVDEVQEEWMEGMACIHDDIISYEADKKKSASDIKAEKEQRAIQGAFLLDKSMKRMKEVEMEGEGEVKKKRKSFLSSDCLEEMMEKKSKQDEEQSKFYKSMYDQNQVMVKLMMKMLEKQ